MIRSSNGEKVSTRDLLFDPRYYLFDTLPQTGQTRFLITNEQVLAEAPFADIRFQPLAGNSVTIATRDLVQLLEQHDRPRPKTHFIFHHAFVCSTLLARCLNQVDAFYALKEPWILRRLADIKRQHGPTIPEPHWHAMYNTYFALLAKNYKSGRALVVKATNVANNLIADIVRYSPEQKILYLYSDIESFLVSNLKKPAATQGKMPELLADFLKDSDFAKQHGERLNTGRLTLLQSCALIWVCNVYALKQVVERSGYSGLCTLDMAHLLSDPEAVLAQVSQHFGHTASAEDLALMTHADTMGRNAKDTAHQYSVELKEEERRQVYNSNQGDITHALQWIESTAHDLELYEFMQSLNLQTDS
jgi:hypothetical protein